MAYLSRAVIGETTLTAWAFLTNVAVGNPETRVKGPAVIPSVPKAGIPNVPKTSLGAFADCRSRRFGLTHAHTLTKQTALPALQHCAVFCHADFVT